MRKSLAMGVGSAAVLAVLVGSGVAGAINEYKGLTYADAVGSIGKSNAVIASRVGEYLPTEQCIVSGSRTDKTSGKVYLYLNCNDESAMNGHPGNSVATPEGKQFMQKRETAKSISDDFAYASEQGVPDKSYCAQNAASCTDFCKQKGVGCSSELMAFLGL